MAWEDNDDAEDPLPSLFSRRPLISREATEQYRL